MRTSIACPRCGTTLTAADRFCSRCGAALPATPTVSGGGATTPVAPDAAALAAEAARVSAAVLRSLADALAPEYQVTRELGAGGMGSVFLAREPTLRRDVAVKVLAPDLARDDTSRARFEREAQAVASLSHPNVVGVYRVGELADGTPYFVMQYVAGESLAARVAREGLMDVAEARRVVAQVASALAAAHAKGIIHRDIKPANVLHDPESNRVLVSDFGIAALRASGETEVPTHLTGTGMSIGTPQYMSPEQLLAEPVSDKTDVYNLGLLGYELLAGRGPFEVTSAREIIAAVLRDTPKPLSSLRSDMDPELEGLLAACLQRDPDARPSAAEVVQRLGLDQPPLIEWPPPGLEALRGEGVRLARRIGTASVPLAGGVLIILEMGTWVPAGSLAVVPLAISLLVTVGVVALGWASWHVGRFALACGRAAQNGYGWGTIAEVTADRRGDSGALISGSREYAALPAAERERLRRWRLLAAALLLAAVALPAATTLGFAFGLAHFLSPALFPLLALVAPGALLVAGFVLVALEDRRLEDARRRLRRQQRKVDWRSLVNAWRVSFESARRGQRLGSGSAARPGTARVVGVGVAVVLALVGFVVLPALLIGAAGPLTWNALVSEIGLGDRGAERLRLAEVMRPFRPALDSTISGEEAGRLFHQLIGNRRSPLPQRPLPGPSPPQWLPDSANPFDFPLGYGDSVMRVAPHGFTPAERQYLRRVAENPGFAILRRLGHAREMDVVLARFALPFPDSASAAEMDASSVPFGLRDAAYASVATAALLVSEGRRAEGESLLFETASFGLLLADEATGSWDAMIGSLVTSIARRGLLSLYESGPPSTAGIRLRRVTDSIIAVSAARTGESDFQRYLGLQRVPDLGRAVLNIVTQEGAPRAVRWKYLRLVAYKRCSNVRELLFGLSPNTEAWLSGARATLVRRSSDTALFDLLLAPPRLVGRGESDLASLVVRLSSRLTRNPWVDYCYRTGLRMATHGEQ
jgi:serine/threonine-protein kinase